MQQGWIKLHRQLLNWEWYQDTPTKVLFLHCLLMANHEDKYFEGQLIPRGSLLTGRELLAKQTGLTVRSVRTALKHLISTSELTKKTTNKGTHIFITNYDNYQSEDIQMTSKTTNKTTSERPASDQQVTTNKNDKNVKNDKNNTYTKKYFKENWQTLLIKAKQEHSYQPEYNGKDFDKVMGEFLEGIEIKDYKYKNYYLAFLKWVRSSRHSQGVYQQGGSSLAIS